MTGPTELWKAGMSGSSCYPRSALIALVVAVVGLLAGCGAVGADKGAVSADEAAKMRLASSIAASFNADASRATSPPTAPVDAAFLARANAVCAPAVAYNEAHPNPYPSFNYLDPDIPTLRKEGAFFAASPYTGALAKLAALGSPTENAMTWSDFRATAIALRQQVLAQNAAAIAGEKAGYVATVSPVLRLAGTLAIDAHQAGFTTGSDCYRLLTSN